ncbi:WD repeat-containing protein 49 isoform X1 [Tachysurus ichikawai]
MYSTHVCKTELSLSFVADKPLTSTPSTKEASTNSSEKDLESYVVTRLAFLEGRKSFAATGGADLVSCGGSGIVCFWNTVNAQLVGKFLAHEGSNSIIMTIDGSGHYLVTADMGGVLKVWDIQEYCLQPPESVIDQAPELLLSLQPHVDRISHLETCVHSGRLFLLSASADCSLALSFLPGGTIGTFGQDVHWNLAGISEAFVKKEQEVSKEVSKVSGTETALQETQPEQSFQHAERSESNTPSEEEKEYTLHLHTLDDDTTGQRSRKIHKAFRHHNESTQHQNVNSACSTSIRIFSKLRVEELASIEELSKPDFIKNPHLYFGKMWDSSIPTPPPLPAIRENLKAPFDEKSLFPKELLEQVDKPRRYSQKVAMIRNYGRAIRSMGKAKASTSGVNKTK